MKNTQNFIICIGLVSVGVLVEPLMNQPILSLISFMSGIGGIVGGGCALVALSQWKKQIEHGKKLDVLEALEKAHTAATSLNTVLSSMYQDMVNYNDSEDENVKNHWKKEYELSYLRFLKGVDRINLLHAELLVKSRLLRAISQDYEVHELMTSVISVAKKATHGNIPKCLPANNDEAEILRTIFHHFDNENNKVCADYRRYLYNSLEIKINK